MPSSVTYARYKIIFPTLNTAVVPCPESPSPTTNTNSQCLLLLVFCCLWCIVYCLSFFVFVVFFGAIFLFLFFIVYVVYDVDVVIAVDGISLFHVAFFIPMFYNFF